MKANREHGQDTLLKVEVGSHEELPAGVDRRTFMMRSAVLGAAAVITGCSPAEKKEAAPAPAAEPPKPASQMSGDLDVVKKAKGPVMTTIDEFYKDGPGPSSRVPRGSGFRVLTVRALNLQSAICNR